MKSQFSNLNEKMKCSGVYFTRLAKPKGCTKMAGATSSFHLPTVHQKHTTTDTSFAFLFGREQTNLGPSVRDRNKTHTQLELLSYFQIIKIQGRARTAWRQYFLSIQNSKDLNELRGSRGKLQRFKLNAIYAGMGLYQPLWGPGPCIWQPGRFMRLSHYFYGLYHWQTVLRRKDYVGFISIIIPTLSQKVGQINHPVINLSWPFHHFSNLAGFSEADIPFLQTVNSGQILKASQLTWIIILSS